MTRPAAPPLAAAALALLMLGAPPVLAQGVRADAGEEILLRNGQWTWIEDAAFQPAAQSGAAGVTILVSLPAQLAFVYRDGVLIAASTVSTGKGGKATPAGDYTILQKRVFHRSNLYSNAPMPFMQRLTWDGIALHAGHLPGYPASHGCIRFPRAFAERLYAVTAIGTAVSVVNYEVVDPRVRRGAPRLPAERIAAAPPPRQGLQRSPIPQRVAATLPYLHVDVAGLRVEGHDDVTFRHDVLIPAIASPPIPADDRVYAPGQRTGRRSR